MSEAAARRPGQLRPLREELTDAPNLVTLARIGLIPLILIFIGVKMLISTWYHFPVQIALGTVAGILIVSVIASVVRTRILAGQVARGESSVDADRH